MSELFGSKYYVSGADGKYHTAQLTPYRPKKKRSTPKKRRLKAQRKQGYGSSLADYSKESGDSEVSVTLVLALTYVWAMLVAIVIPQWVLVIAAGIAIASLPVAILQRIIFSFQNRRLNRVVEEEFAYQDDQSYYEDEHSHYQDEDSYYEDEYAYDYEADWELMECTGDTHNFAA